MSGPFRFTPEPAGSPLERAASPFATPQPVSFKTNVNRAKTTKWVQAKKNAYDGDDWGDYDEYDEYGVNEAHDQPARNFTAPAAHAALPTARRNSFERGEEQRAFSSSATAHHAAHHAAPQDRLPQDHLEQHPLRISQLPTSLTPSPPTSAVVSQRLRTGSNADKPLPFIRPADIYKRAQEERLREQAPHDSLARPGLAEDAAPPTAAAFKTLPPLETLTRRRSGSFPRLDVAVPVADEQGLRSVVDHAFVRNDDPKSVPPTPIAKDATADSDMSRANTGSTLGISPIMSRVPSGAAAAARSARNPAGEGTTPVIAEETTSEVVSPITLPTTTPDPCAPQHDPPATSPAHGRNVSASSLPRSGFATPTRGDSPARSSVISPPRNVPEPTTAQIATEGLESPDAIEGDLTSSALPYATQEADMAHAAAKRFSISASPQLAASETQSPTQDIFQRDRSESPSKGRVHALAGKFGDVSHSRRGSTQSTISKKSRNSVQSWENSRDNSRAASPTKASPSKPGSPFKEFRPHLPGQWESYATTANTPLEQEHHGSELSFTRKHSSPSVGAVDLTPTTAKRLGVKADASEASQAPATLVEDPMTALKDAGTAMVQSIRETVGLDDPASDHQPSSNDRQPAHGNIYLPRPLQLERAISSQSSLVPTSSERGTPDSELIPSPLVKEQTPGTSTRQQRSLLDPELSSDPSAGDQESDRLRKEIVASLSPIRFSTAPATDGLQASLQPLASPDNRVSSILPREYDTYWAEADSASPQTPQDADITTPIVPLTVGAGPVTHSEESAKPSILHRFSWEVSNPPSQSQDEPLSAVAMESTTAPSMPDGNSLPVAEHAGEEKPPTLSEKVSEESSGAGHVITVTKPESIVDPKLDEDPSLPPLDAISLASPTRERTRSPGLHVVNTREDPEAVDLPPRLSADREQTPLLGLSPKDDIVLSSAPAIEPPSEVSKATSSAPATSVASAPALTSAPALNENPATSPMEKPLGGREIASISSSAERIATYNKTREQWATIDHGLHNWLTCTLHANPELSSQPFPVQRAATGTIRHRHTSSLALLGKLSGSSHHEPTVSEQQGSASAHTPAGSASPPSARPSGAGFGGRVASQHMQLKGEKLLHTANVLGGKGMTSAKGLFAKGKSRFGRDKQGQ